MKTLQRIGALVGLMLVPVVLALTAEGLAARPGPPAEPTAISMAVAAIEVGER